MPRGETSNFEANEAPSVLLSDSGASETSAIAGAKIARWRLFSCKQGLSRELVV